jgi:hypothetical protein
MTPRYLKQLDRAVRFKSALPRGSLSHVSFGLNGKGYSARAADHEGMTIAYAEGKTLAACLKTLSKKL